MGKLLDSLAAAVKASPAASTPSPNNPLTMPRPVADQAPAPSPQMPSVSALDPMLMAAMGVDPQAQVQQPVAPQSNPMADIYSQGITQPPPAPAPVQQDNAYTPYDNNSPAAIANSIGTPEDRPIDIVGDSWKPHKESKLGRLMDTFLQMDGHRPVFQDRTDDRNLKDAMQGTNKDKQLLLDRVKKFNPDLALKMEQDMSSVNANNALAEQRAQARQETGRTNMTGMLNSIQGSSDPAGVYEKQLPMLRKYADSYGVSGDELPDQYDADAIKTYIGQAMTPAQQQSLKQGADEHKDLQTERQSDVDLRKQQLKIEQYNSDTSRMNAETARDSLDNRSDNMDAGTLSQRQSLYKQMLGGAAKVPWLYGGFVKGVFGSGSKGIPVPGKVYVSPDKTMAVKLNGNGSWSVYDLSKGLEHAREIQRLGGVVAGASQDFSD